jgi:outer membrane protein insertion porin family
MRAAKAVGKGAVLFLHCALCIVHLALPASAQTPAAALPTVTELRIEQEGRLVTDPAITSLIETAVGKPLDIQLVRESLEHLNSLNRFDDVRAYRDDSPGGVRVRYVLFPSHPVDKIEFRGMVALAEDDLRRAVRDRFGLAIPPARRRDEVARLLKDTYRLRGYPQASVTPRLEETHNPERATLVFEIDAGPRVAISQVTVNQEDKTPPNVVVGAPDVRAGQPYDAERIDKELDRYAASMRERGYLEARASHMVEFEPSGAEVTLDVFRGPHVTIAFTGDPIPSGERDRLVPIKNEGSVSQDLLEDAQNGIINYLHGRGYRDAMVDYMPVQNGDELTLTFDIRTGPRYLGDDLSVSGNTAVTSADIINAFRFKKGEPYVQSTVDAGIVAVRNMYRNQGYTNPDVRTTVDALPNRESEDSERRVNVTVAITEGQRTIVRSVTFRGNAAISEEDLRRPLTSMPGKPYSEVDLVADRDLIEVTYRNRGYETVTVTPAVSLAENNTQADITLTVSEGQQIFVDHIIINGNRRTKREIIQRELVLKEGAPLGSSALIESQQRLTALGLFRRVRITAIQHGSDPSRDVLVDVEEAPPNSQAYGAGVEVGSYLRTNAQGQAEERLEFVPRGSFEIGRRNMGGKNRSIDLFTRVSLRQVNQVVVDDATSQVQATTDTGFNEYRVFTTYREPRVFNTRSDLLLTGTVEQASRSSFDFNRREARAELGLRVSDKYSLAGRYSFERTRLFNEVFTEDEQPIIDRLFPQVRLSKLSGTVIRGRQDLLDPAGGNVVSMTTDLALRSLGSEVGFVKTYLEAFAYPQLPLKRRTILALGGRLGVAHGFARVVDSDLVEDLPASERFFAGGDTTVRGFSLDRLGTTETITSSGFPTGGNAVVILNAELRVSMPWSVQAVTFIDAGNVYTKVSELDLTELRPAVGFGARIKLPLLSAPVRVDWGINLDPRELVPGTLERHTVLHVSLGQAF